MRYMRWSYADLMTCPADMIEVIVETAKREQAEARNAARAPGRRRR